MKKLSAEFSDVPRKSLKATQSQKKQLNMLEHTADEVAFYRDLIKKQDATSILAAPDRNVHERERPQSQQLHLGVSRTFPKKASQRQTPNSKLFSAETRLTKSSEKLRRESIHLKQMKQIQKNKNGNVLRKTSYRPGQRITVRAPLRRRRIP